MSRTDVVNTRASLCLNRRRFLIGAGTLGATTLMPSLSQANGSLAQFFWPHSDGPDVSHKAWGALLQKYVVAGPDNLTLVRYRQFQSDRAALKSYIAYLAKSRPSGLERASSAAYWINLYNALTIDVVLEHYPVNSIRDINLGGGLLGRGPWKAKLVTVEGKDLSLDNIEHDILRPTLGMYGVHYSVNCASISCPSLQPAAFTKGNLGKNFRKGAREYIGSTRGVKIDGDRIVASKIYDWYVNDFGGKSRVKSHWLVYASNSKAAAIETARLAGYDYDWSLNDAG